MDAGSIVLLHLVAPSEKYWGALLKMTQSGITVRAVNISSFEDWMREVAYEDEPGLGPATLFFPLHRVERMSLDEPMGPVESMSQMLERRVGRSAAELLGLVPEAEPSETTH
ncbi:MAG: hypothetical protein AAGN66_14755 [Acidobacteriota bacterium]